MIFKLQIYIIINKKYFTYKIMSFINIIKRLDSHPININNKQSIADNNQLSPHITYNKEQKKLLFILLAA